MKYVTMRRLEQFINYGRQRCREGESAVFTATGRPCDHDRVI